VLVKMMDEWGWGVDQMHITVSFHNILVHYIIKVYSN